MLNFKFAFLIIKKIVWLFDLSFKCDLVNTISHKNFIKEIVNYINIDVEYK